MDLHEIGLEVEWMDMVQDRENWRAVAKALRTLWLP